MVLKGLFQSAVKQLDGPIARSAIAGIVIRFAGMALMFVQAILLARLLGAEGYGVVTVLLAVGQIATAFILGGLGSFAVAEVPRQLRAGRSSIAWEFTRFGARSIALSGIVVLPLAWGAVWLLLGPTPLALTLPLLVSIPIMAGILLLRGVAQGIKRPTRAQLPGEFIRPALLVIALALAWSLADFDSALFMMIYAGTALLTLVIACSTIARSGSANGAASAVSLKEPWGKLARPFLGIHLFSILQLELATLMLGLLATPEAVGQFQPVARIAMVMLVPIQALSLAFNPKISALFADNRHTDIAALARKWTLAATGSMIAGGLVVALFASHLLALFGPAFSGNEALIWLLICGRILQAAFGPGFELLSMTGNAQLGLKSQGFGIAAESLCALALIPALGITGAAVAIVLGIAVRGCALVYWTSQKLGIGWRQCWLANASSSPA